MRAVKVLLLFMMLSMPVVAEEVTIGDAAPPDAPVKEIAVTAKKYEYNPATLEVPAGTVLVIKLTALDRSHGFRVTGFEPCAKVDPEKGGTTIRFYTAKPGTYQFACCKFCGFGHGKMKGKIVVTEQQQTAPM